MVGDYGYINPTRYFYCDSNNHEDYIKLLYENQEIKRQLRVLEGRIEELEKKIQSYGKN